MNHNAVFAGEVGKTLTAEIKDNVRFGLFCFHLCASSRALERDKAERSHSKRQPQNKTKKVLSCGCDGKTGRPDMVDWQCGWGLCLHRVRHEAAKAARPGACRCPLGDILREVEWRNGGEGPHSMRVVNPKKCIIRS